MGRVILFALLLVQTSFSFADSSSYTDLFQFRQGELQADETWSGMNMLLGDVIVPEHITLTIQQNSWLVFNEADLTNSGKRKSRPELIVHGRLVKPESIDSIRVYSLSDPAVQEYIQKNTDHQAIEISPKEEPLTDLKDNLHESRRYYSWLWALVYSIWLIF